MSLKSFPKSASQRQVILFLQEGDILDIGMKAEKSKDLAILEDPSVLIIPFPVADCLKSKNPALENIIDDYPNLKSGDLLILDQGQVVESRSGYLPIPKVIDSFIDRNYELACAYSSFFAALGATRVFIEHKKEQSSIKKNKAEAKVEGMVSSVTDVDMCFFVNADKKMSEIMRFDTRYSENKKNLDEKIKDAEKVLNEKNIVENLDCQHILGDFRNGFIHSRREIYLSDSKIENQQINALVNFGLKLPAQEILNKFNLGSLVEIKLVAERTKAFFLERSTKIIVEWGDQ